MSVCGLEQFRSLNVHPDVAACEEELLELRRHLHANPELAFQETNTSVFITAFLNNLRIDDASFSISTELGKPPHMTRGHGVVAVLKGRLGPGPCIALRADMDALPIQETTGLPFAAANGCMHACGHDGHMSMLLMAAKILFSKRSQLKGSVKFIFQPAEEFGGGAKYMIESGVLEDVDEIYGIHLWTPSLCGYVDAVSGPVMACGDKFSIIVKDQGGHAACPHECVDVVFVSSLLIVAVQSIVSRNISPSDPAVVSICHVSSGNVSNVIPQQSLLEGTVRAFSSEVRQLIRDRISDICEGFHTAFHAEIVLEFDDVNYGYPPVVNAEKPTENFRLAAEATVDPSCVRSGQGGNVGSSTGCGQPTMGGEDMAYYLQEVPGCFGFVGAGIPDKPLTPHHCSQFLLDETSLLIGCSVHVRLIENLLGA